MNRSRSFLYKFFMIAQTATLALACVLTMPLFAQEQELLIKWDAVKGATEYRVEVVDPGLQPVFRQKTKETRVTIKVKPGDYHYRLASVDEQGAVSEWSTWKRLRVLSAQTPILENRAPQTLELDQPGDSILLRGRNFSELSIIRFRDRDGREVPIRSKEMLADGGVRVFFDKPNAKPGRYNLSLQNPRGQETVLVNYLRIPVPPEKVYNYWQPLVPGVYQFRQGEAWKGSLLLGAAVGLGAGAGFNWWRANALIGEKQGDILLNFYTNPVVFLALRDQVENINQHTSAAQFYFVRGSQLSNEINVHRSNYNAFRAALGVLYAIHIVDILGFGKNVTNNYAPGELSRPIVTGVIAGSDENPFAAFSVSFIF